MIDLNIQRKPEKKNDGFDGVPFGAVCGFILIAWTIGCLLASLLGWL